MDFKKKVGSRQVLKAVELPGRIRAGHGDIPGEWVTIAVLSKKGHSRETKTRKKYCVWTLSDLHKSEFSLFLFGEAYQKHWKESEGSIIALLNASVLPAKKEGHREGDVSLSLDQPTQLMKLGTSNDYGICKGIRKDGARCSMAINKSLGEYCDYHVMAGFKKHSSKRMDLNRAPVFNPQKASKFSRDTTSVRPKVRRNQPTTVSDEFIAKQRTNSHFMRQQVSKQVQSNVTTSRGSKSNTSNGLVPKVVSDSQVHTTISSTSALQLLSTNKRKTAVDLPTGEGSRLARGLTDRSQNVSFSADEAKLKALKVIKAQGGIRKEDPNKTSIGPSSSTSLVTRVVKSKRAMQIAARAEPAPKLGGRQEMTKPKSKLAKLTGIQVDLSSDAGKVLLLKQSKNAAYAEAARDAAQERRWDDMEEKERMESRMANIFEQEVLGFKCRECNVTTEYFPRECKESNHTIDKKKAIKRWFQCQHCKYQFRRLNCKMPTNVCKCNSKPPSYKRVAMRQERSVKSVASGLKIRGNEQKWVTSLGQ